MEVTYGAFPMPIYQVDVFFFGADLLIKNLKTNIFIIKAQK